MHTSSKIAYDYFRVQCMSEYNKYTFLYNCKGKTFKDYDKTYSMIMNYFFNVIFYFVSPASESDDFLPMLSALLHYCELESDLYILSVVTQMFKDSEKKLLQQIVCRADENLQIYEFE